MKIIILLTITAYFIGKLLNISWYLIAFAFYVLYWFFKDQNPYKTYMIIGKKGSGKTCDIAKRSLKYQKLGYKVYSNIEIPGNYIFNPKDMSSWRFEDNSVVMLDEIGLLYDARKFKSFDDGLNEFYKYSRQYKTIIYLYSQSFTSDVDLKIRNLVDKMFLMVRIGKITLIKPINKILTIGTDINGNGQLIDNFKFDPIFFWKFNYMPRYYGLFKSYDPPKRELISATKLQYDEISSLFIDSKKWALYRVRYHIHNIRNYISSRYNHGRKKIKTRDNRE